MSLAFQNSEYVKEALFVELQNLLSSDTNVLKAAEMRIKQLEFTEGYGVYLSELIMNQIYELPLRQIASIMLTRYVENHWYGIDAEGNRIELNSAASEQAKRTIRNILPNGLYDPNSKIRTSVAHTITTIATTDWPTIWTELFDIIIKCLGGNEDSIHGALQVLQEFTYDDKQIKELGSVVISEVFRIFDSDTLYSIKTRTSAIKILKPMFKSIDFNIINKQEQSTMMNSILNTFMNKLLFYLSMNSGTSSNFLLRSEIIKVLTYLVTDNAKHIDPFMERILPIIWQLLTQMADTYVKVIVNQTEKNPFPDGDEMDDDELANFTTMIVQIFEFILCIVSSGKINTDSIKNVLTDLIYIIIVYTQITEELLEEWNEDQEKFVQDEEDDGTELTIRLAGKDVLAELNDKMDVDCLTGLQEALRRHMSVAEAEKAAGSPHWWKIQEACLMAVDAFNDSILEKDNDFDLLSYLSFLRNLLNNQGFPQLVGRAIRALSTYSKSSVYNSEMLDDILGVTLRCMETEKPILLKISTVRSIYGFIRAHKNSSNDKRAVIEAKLPAIFESIMNLVPIAKCAVLTMLMETLTAIIMFDPTFTNQVQSKLISLAIAIFLKYPEDPYIFTIVQEMIRALCQNPMCLGAVQERFVPTIVSILTLKDDHAVSAKQDIALDALTTIVRYSKQPLPECIVENAFPAMIECVLRTDDTSVMVAAGECLRTLIYISPEQICSYKNGEGLNYVMKLTTMLLDPKNSEMTAGQIGLLVITIITKVGNMLGENVDMLLKAVISKMQLVDCLTVVMSLVVVFAHLILTEMEAVLNFLSTVPGPTGEPAMKFVITNWLTRQTYFYGTYVRKVTVMALCKLFEYGVTTQDNRLISITIKEQIELETVNDTGKRRTRSQTGEQTWIDMPILVKIFKILINELYHIRESKLDATLSDSDDNDDTGADDNVDADDDGNVNNSGGKSAEEIALRKQAHLLSSIYYGDEDDTEFEDDLLLNELLQEPLFQSDLENNLTQFLQQFSTSEHFGRFFNHLNLNEKKMLETIGLTLVA